jgi:hypothetical protein
LVSLPSEKYIVRCKWFYKNNKVVDVQVSMYKERLVSKGFQQIHGIDYDETFAPVENIEYD